MNNRWGLKKTIITSTVYFLTFVGGVYLWRNHSNVYLIILWLVSTLHFYQVEKELNTKGLNSYEDIMFFSIFTLPVLQKEEFYGIIKVIHGELFYEHFIVLHYPIIITQLLFNFFCFKKTIHSKTTLFFVYYLPNIVCPISKIKSNLPIFFYIHFYP